MLYGLGIQLIVFSLSLHVLNLSCYDFCVQSMQSIEICNDNKNYVEKEIPPSMNFLSPSIISADKQL